jgi:predicted Zn-dependent peptidase
LVQIELNKLCLKPLTETQLKAAKKQIIGQIAVASDNFENVALEMGKSFLHYRKFEPQESVFQRILALTPQQLQEVAKEMFTPDRMSMLMFR